MANLDLLMENAQATGEFIKASVIRELKEQGHIINITVPGFSESLEDSFEIRIARVDNGIHIQLWGNDYALEMDTGLSGSQIKYDPLEMIHWAKIIKPELDDRQLEAYMKALHASHEKKGSPLDSSYNWSQNGRRTGFIHAGIIEHAKDLEDILGLFAIVDQAANRLVVALNEIKL